MLLNYNGSRSYNDLSQYPVIPWFLDYDVFHSSDLATQESNIRDFSKNLANLGSKKRLEHFIDQYETLDGPESQRYFMGSHYSNPGVVLSFLIRLPPFLDSHIKFQSGKLD